MNHFFESSRYVVVGASKDPSKFGNKVLKWYTNHQLNVTPIHPKESTIESIQTVPNLATYLEQVKDAQDVSVSVVTPPKISLNVVRDGILKQGVGYFWLQPGAEDAELISWVKIQPQHVQDRIIYGGPCILVSGAELARAKGKL